jgi:hypothetical protein
VLAFLPVVESEVQLPTEAGQVWQTYDIGAFVEVAGPGSQEHVVDWVLQETGYEAWHGETVAWLTAAAAMLVGRPVPRDRVGLGAMARSRPECRLHRGAPHGCQADRCDRRGGAPPGRWSMTSW